MRSKSMVVLATLGACLGAHAQGTKPLDQLQREEQFKRSLETIEAASVKLNNFIRRRERDCALAIGYAPFCDCLMKHLPIAWSFSDYIAITTKTKEENGYAALDAEVKQAYDAVGPIRDRCVKLINVRR